MLSAHSELKNIADRCHYLKCSLLPNSHSALSTQHSALLFCFERFGEPLHILRAVAPRNHDRIPGIDDNQVFDSEQRHRPLPIAIGEIALRVERDRLAEQQIPVLVVFALLKSHPSATSNRIRSGC